MARSNRRWCAAPKAKGGKCRALPLVPGQEVGGVVVSGKFCFFHDPDIPEEVKRSKKTPLETAKRVVETHQAHFLRPFFRAVGLDIDDDMNVTPLPGGGAKLTGTYQGKVIQSDIEDLGAQQAAVIKLITHIWGNPRQQTELVGADGGPIQVDFGQLARSAMHAAADEAEIADAEVVSELEAAPEDRPPEPEPSGERSDPDPAPELAQPDPAPEPEPESASAAPEDFFDPA